MSDFDNFKTNIDNSKFIINKDEINMIENYDNISLKQDEFKEFISKGRNDNFLNMKDEQKIMKTNESDLNNDNIKNKTKDRNLLGIFLCK